MAQRYAFDCAKCGKNIQITWEMYTGYYEGHTLCLSCRPAEKAKTALILTEEELKEIDELNNTILKKKSINRLIASHRQLLSANAELSFNNMTAKAKVREYYLGLKSVKGINQIGADHAMLAIENVLDAFKIKIEDVNA